MIRYRRRNFAKAMAALFFGIGLSATPTLANGDSNSIDGFWDIRLAPGLARADEFIDTIRPFLLDHPESLEGRASVDLTVRKEDDGFAVDITKSGYLDDSVRGEHYRGFVIRTSDGKWELLSMSVKPECWRGEPTDRRCP